MRAKKRRAKRKSQKSTRILALFVVLCLCLTAPSYGSRVESEPKGNQSAELMGDASSAHPLGAGVSPENPAETSMETEAPPTPTPEPEEYVITMIGDCTLASVSYYASTAGSYSNVVGDDYAYPFALTKEYFEDDDFTIANLECVLSNYDVATDKNFVFRAVPEYVNIMTEGCVDFVTLGNNHVLDYGEQGYADTKAALDGVGIGYAGRDEWTIYTGCDGLVIGVYAVSFGSVADIQAGIQALKDNGAELIIACLHWGDEGSYDVNNKQYEQGRAAIDAGAQIVMGSHPHTLQPVEEYNGGYIYYSVGNWTFGGNTNPRDKDTVIVRITVERAYDGTVTVTNREHIPCSCSGDLNGNNYQPVVCEPDSEQYQRVLAKLDGSFDGSNLSINYEYNFNEY